MTSNVRCWAAILGNCSGPITREHYVTGKLFKRRVTISGDYAMTEGTCPEWLTQQGLERSIRRLSVNMLCDSHNKILGKNADRAAIDLQKALTLKDPLRLKGSKILRPPVARAVSGVHFGQWLCKTHCNIMTASSIIPELSFVQYSYGHSTEKKLYFYTPAKVGKKLQVGEGHVTYALYSYEDDPHTKVFEITLAGYKTIVTSFPIDPRTTVGLIDLKESLIDRIKCIQRTTDLGLYKVHIDWRNEPS